MFFMGLLKNLGKMVLVNIIKDIGKEALRSDFHKNNLNFNEILKANLDITPKTASDKIMKSKNNQEDLKKIVIKKLKDLESKILKKNLPEDTKNKIIKKIDELIDILSKQIVNIKISEEDNGSIKVTIKINNEKKDILTYKDNKNDNKNKEINIIPLHNKLSSLIKEIKDFIKKNNINGKITLNIIEDKKIEKKKAYKNSKLLNFNSPKIDKANKQNTKNQPVKNEKPIIQNQFSSLNVKDNENPKNNIPFFDVSKNKNFTAKNNSNKNFEKISQENSKINMPENIFAKRIKNINNKNNSKEIKNGKIIFDKEKSINVSKASNQLNEIDLFFEKIHKFSNNKDIKKTKITAKELLNKIINNSQDLKKVKISQSNFLNSDGAQDNLEKNLKHNNLIKKNIETFLAKKFIADNNITKEETVNFNDNKEEKIQNFQFLNVLKKSHNIKNNKFANVKNLENKSNIQDNIISQIKKSLPNNLNLKSEVSIKLNPPELGKIHLKLVMINNDLSAKITTENSIVKNVILHNLNQLQETLVEKGINLSNFNVTVQGEFADNNSNQQKFEKRYFSSNFGELIDKSAENNEIYEFINDLNNTLNLKV